MSNIKNIDNGTITSPKGFLAGATYIGLKTYGSNLLDLGIISSETSCITAGMFTTSKIKAAPVVLCQSRIKGKKTRAIVVNSGCANAFTGEQGTTDATEMAALTAKKLDLSPEEVLVASTGIIGVPLQMERIREGIEKITFTKANGHNMAKAIMTTDTFPKETALKVKIGSEETEITIGGIAKGSGMIHPNMATMLCFLTTDAVVQPNFLDEMLKKAVDVSFNMITVDGDTSPNDSVIILANGLAGNDALDNKHPDAEDFEEALTEVCLFLAKQLAKDGEGATKLIEVSVDGSSTTDQARIGARTIASSSLVKSAIHGSDPNWGRIVAALGQSGIEMDESSIDLYIHDTCLIKTGQLQPFNKPYLKGILDASEVFIRVSLNLGNASATAWGCDLSEEYVRINGEYTT